MKKINKNLIIFLIICAVVFGVSFFVGVSEVKTSSSENVSGYAWSENIGWISFNCTNQDTCGSVDYGVDIAQDGIFSGHAWSEHVGWISFNASDLSGCPSGTCQAEMNLGTGEISGWAKVLTSDEWISLRGTTPDYGLSLNMATKKFEGWAWGSDVVGWVSFNCINQGVCATSDYKVIAMFSLPPSAENLSVNQGDYCSSPLHPTFSWTFSDPDLGDTQEAYQVQVDNNSNFSSPELDSDKVISSSNSYSTPSPLSYNATYYWRVKVWDDWNTESSWAVGPSFTTPLHAYPDPVFTKNPSVTTLWEFVQFCSTQETGVCDDDVSKCYDNNNNEISCGGKSFLWTFPDSSTTTENPLVQFISIGSNNVSLEITDDVGTCLESENLWVGFRLPIWRETEVE